MAQQPAIPPTTAPADAPPPRGPRPPRPRARRARRIVVGLVLVLAAMVAFVFTLPRAGLPEDGSFTVRGGEATGAAATRYRAGPLRRALLGAGWRDAWAAEIRVPVLDPDTFAGGLTAIRPGTGNQTRSLHLRGADGRDYVFRVSDKDQGGRLRGLARATWGRVRQDQIGALHPASAIVASGLMDATEVPHTRPRLVVAPDHPRLGQHRAAFAGRLGIIEENPRDGFGGARRVTDTEELLGPPSVDRPDAPVDPRAYLTARLMDVLMGDWDRHEGQWRWALRDAGGAARWVPLPRDRDYAFADYGGLFPTLARTRDPKIVRFDGPIRDLPGLMVDAGPLDARFLCPLPPAAWDSTAARLRTALTDSAITASVGRMPAPYVRLTGGELTRTLRARRDALPTAARDFRRRLHADGACASPPAPREPMPWRGPATSP